MFTCQIRIVSTNEYSTILINTNLTRLLNELRFLNPNMTYLLNRTIMSTHLLYFIKEGKKKKTTTTTKNFSID